MIVETLASSPDIIQLAQDTTTIGIEGAGDFDGLNIRFAPSVVKVIRFISIVLAVVWLFFLIWNLGKPGGSRQAVQKMGGVFGIVIALVVIVAGLNPNFAMEVLDSILKIGWIILTSIKGFFSK